MWRNWDVLERLAVGACAAAVLSSAAGCRGEATEDTADARVGRATMSDGVRLHYSVVGRGEPTVLVPVGFYLEEHLRSLADKRRMVFYDPRGRARSDRGSLASVSLDRNVQDLEELRVELGVDTMDLIGWSGLGMEMAVYALRYPERVRRLVQVSPVPPSEALMMSLGGDTRLSEMDRVELAGWDSLADAGEVTEQELCRLQNAITLPTNFFDRERAASVVDVCQWENEWPGPLGEYFDQLLGSFAGYDWVPDLPRLNGIPRLVIHGENDGIPIAGAVEWVRGAPNARLIRLDRAGHFTFIERREAVLSAIDVFLGGDWPAEAEVVSAEG